MRLAAAEERGARAEWEAREAGEAARRELAAARAEAADWKREAAAAEAEAARAGAAAKLGRRGSGASFGGTPRALRGATRLPAAQHLVVSTSAGMGMAQTAREPPTNPSM